MYEFFIDLLGTLFVRWLGRVHLWSECGGVCRWMIRLHLSNRTWDAHHLEARVDRANTGVVPLRCLDMLMRCLNALLLLCLRIFEAQVWEVDTYEHVPYAQSQPVSKSHSCHLESLR